MWFLIILYNPAFMMIFGLITFIAQILKEEFLIVGIDNGVDITVI